MVVEKTPGSSLAPKYSYPGYGSAGGDGGYEDDAEMADDVTEEGSEEGHSEFDE